jgi:hypothetical protein
MSLTVKQLLTNHARGINSNVKTYEDGYYNTEIPQFDDITEYHQFKQDLKAKSEAEEKRHDAKLASIKKAKTLKDTKPPEDVKTPLQPLQNNPQTPSNTSPPTT